MAIFAILRHILSLYSNQKTTCASSISAVRENRSPRNHQRFLADTNSKKSLRKGETSQRVAHGVRPAVGYKKRTPDAGDLKIGRGEASFRVRGKEPFVPTQG